VSMMRASLIAVPKNKQEGGNVNLKQELAKKRKTLASLVGRDYLTKELKDYFHGQLIFLSSNIEDVVISLEEAEDIVAQYPNFKEIPANSKSLLQAKGQKIALEYVEDFARGNQPINADTIRTIHRMVFDQGAPEMAGQYREELIKIRGTEFIPTIHYFIPGEMKDFDDGLRHKLPRKNASIEDILDFATWAHYEVVRVHPFIDGNGRVARTFFNLICRRYNLPYVLVPKSGTEKRMWDGLHAANQGDLSKLSRYYGELLGESYDFVINAYQKKTGS